MLAATFFGEYYPVGISGRARLACDPIGQVTRVDGARTNRECFTVDNSFIQKSLASRVGNRFLAIPLLIIVLVLTYFLAGRVLIRDLNASYTEVKAVALEEKTERVFQGSRRAQQWINVRTVTMEFSLDGQTRQEPVESDSIQVGSEVTVWVEDTGKGLEVYSEEKTGPRTAVWVGTAIGLFIALLFVWGIASSFRASRLIKRADPFTQRPLFEMEALEVKSKLENKKSKPKPDNVRILILGRVTHSTTPDVPLGAEFVLQNLQSEMPSGQFKRLSIFPLREGKVASTVFVSGAGQQVWWLSELTEREASFDFK